MAGELTDEVRISRAAQNERTAAYVAHSMSLLQVKSPAVAGVLDAIREGFTSLATAMIRATPPCGEQNLAVKGLEEAEMWAIRAVLLHHEDQIRGNDLQQ